MKMILLAVTIGVALSSGFAAPLQAREAAASVQTVAVVDPAEQLQAAVRHLRNNDVAGLLRASMPAGQFQMMRGAYEMQRSKPIEEKDRAEFEEAIAKLTANDAVDRLMAEFEPKLNEIAPQAEGGILMALGAMQMALAQPDNTMTAEQREMLRAVLPGLERWLKGTDFFNPATAREALTLVTRAARDTGIQNLDQLKMLSFEEALGSASKMFAASKRAVKLYGLDIDAIAASARFQTLKVEGNKALVRATVTVFDAPLSHELELTQIEGRWYGKDAVIRFESETKAEREEKS